MKSMLGTVDPLPRVSDSSRLQRMQRMFDADRAILAEDYEHFSGVKVKPREATRLNKAGRMSATLREQRCQEPS